METGGNDHPREKLEVYRPVLLDCVIPTDLLLSLTDVLSAVERQEIRNLTRRDSTSAGTARLLDLLVERAELPGRWRMLLDALNHNGYECLSTVLDGKMDLVDMQKYRKIIDIFSKTIQKCVKPLDILEPLKHSRVLSQEDKETIEAEDDNHGSMAGMAVLLDHIYRKHHDWYGVFLRTLADNGYGHLAEEIDPDFMKQWQVQREEADRPHGGDVQESNTTMENYTSVSGDGQTNLKDQNLACPPISEPDITNGSLEEETQLKMVLDDLHSEVTPAITCEVNEDTPQSHVDIPDPVENLPSNPDVYVDGREPTEHDESSMETPGSDAVNGVTSSSPAHTETALGCDQPLFRYQEELAQPGLEGHNSVVVAPTNSGKTHVALRIMQDHLRRNPSSKMFFMVPTSALAIQQADRCHEFLKCQVKVLTGETMKKENFVEMSKNLEKYNVIVCTPQLLVNALMSPDNVTLSELSLLVFDECHRTYEDTPYNKIMQLYLDLKLERGDVPLPQILGMTASLGTGQAKSQSSADAWVKNIIGNLDTQKLVTVRENVEELERRVSKPPTDVILTEPRENTVFGDLVNEMMVIIEAKIAFLCGDFRRPPVIRGTEQYTEWSAAFRIQVTNTPDDDVHRSLKTYAGYIEVYNRALLIYQDARVRDAIRLLDDSMEDLYYANTAIDTDNEMNTLYKEKRCLMEGYDDPDQENPKLQEVQSNLTAQFRADHDSRAIIYVKTIELAKAMEAWMKESPELMHLNAVRFVGAHASEGIGGITRTEQDTILQSFREGGHKVVIGTSVLEEGLDVPRCNLVILYDHVTNEIQRVQTRGRNRRENSRYVLISSKDGRAAQKEIVNESRENMGSAAILKVQEEIERDPHRFLKQQREQQLEDKHRRDANRLQRQQQLENNPVYEVKCIKCRQFLCLSSDLRKIKVHHTIVATGLRDKFAVGERSDPAFVDRDMEHGVAHIYCKTCSIKLGNVSKSLDLYFPMPSVESLQFHKDKGFKTCKKWKNVAKLFAIQDFDREADIQLLLNMPSDDREFYSQ